MFKMVNVANLTKALIITHCQHNTYLVRTLAEQHQLSVLVLSNHTHTLAITVELVDVENFIPGVFAKLVHVHKLIAAVSELVA